MSDKGYLIAIDEGTTGCRAVLFNAKTMECVATADRQLKMSYPQSGWVEQNATEIYNKQIACITDVFDKNGVMPNEVYALGITNQRESVVIWDRTTGKPLAPSINWQCRRTMNFCTKLQDVGMGETIKQKTGLVVDAYFSASKLKWLLDNVRGARAKAKKGELLAGTIDSYLIYRMTGCKNHVTDVTNASRTMLYNIKEMKWDDELLKLFDIPKNILPQVLPSAGDFGSFEINRYNIPICGVAGDQQASMIGQTCFDKGDTKCTYGTGAFVLTNIGEDAIITKSPLITTIAYTIGDKTVYAFEGSVFNAGSTIQWLKQIGLIKSSAESEKCARAVGDSDGVFLIPAFTGLGAPYWDMDCRAGIVGVTRATTKNHIVRAGLESIAFRTAEVCELMEGTLGTPIAMLHADGGASENAFLMQFQSDLLDIRVSKSNDKEGSSRGAIYLAAIGCGLIKSEREISSLYNQGVIYNPTAERYEIEALKQQWRKALNGIKNY